MRYFILFALLLTSCSRNSGDYLWGYSGVVKYLDATTLPECGSSISNCGSEFITMTADNGDVLYVAVKGSAMCLKRHKTRKGPQKRPHEKK